MKTLRFVAFLFLVCSSTFAMEPLIVAHRGASKDAPENTLPAFNLAWEQGADAIEGDFLLTKDGHIVCIHDRNTRRVSGRDLVVKESMLAELQELDVGAWHGENFKGTRIPTIAEVFATIPDRKKIYIEIKCGPEIVPALLRAIEDSELAREQIVVISFNKSVIQRVKAEAPQYKANWLSSFKREESGAATPSLEMVLATLETINADGFSSTKSLIDKAFIQRVRNEGYEYHVWTVNELVTARRFKDWGALSITTDVPGALRAGLAESSSAGKARAN